MHWKLPVVKTYNWPTNVLLCYDVMLHFVSFNADPNSLGRKCVAQQAVCLYLMGCKTPFLSVIVYSPSISYRIPKKVGTIHVNNNSFRRCWNRTVSLGFWLRGKVLVLSIKILTLTLRFFCGENNYIVVIWKKMFTFLTLVCYVQSEKTWSFFLKCLGAYI